MYFSPPAGGAAADSLAAPSGGPVPPGPEGQMGVPPPGPDGMAPGGMGQPGAAQLPADGAVGLLPGTIPGGIVPAENLPVAGLPPASGAEGPPLGELTAAPDGSVQTSGSRLEKHLRVASELWSAQEALAKASSKEAVRLLAADLGAHAQSVPAVGDHMPPMQEVAGYLASSRVLLDRMQVAGMDVAELSLQIDMMMRPPRGKFPGGVRAGSAPQ